MRESIRRCLSVLMVAAVVTSGTFAFVNLDQGPEPVQQYGPVQDSEALVPAVAAGVVALAAGAHTASKFLGGDNVDEDAIRGADDRETHVQTYMSASQSAKSGEQVSDTYQNMMTDASHIAQLEGQNAYIRALENSSGTLPTKSAVKGEAVSEANDWVAARQIRLLNRYSKLALDWKTMHDTAVSEANESWADSMWAGGRQGPNYDVHVTNESVELANGTTHTVTGWSYVDDVGDTNWIDTFYDSRDGGVWKNGVGEYDRMVYMDASKWYDAWAATETAQSEAETTVQNFIDGTYDKYERGAINTSELVTPTLAARNYAPDGDNGVYTQRALTRMGYSLPTDFSDTKTMNLVADGEERTGVLLSDGLPAGGEWEIGKEYQVANIEGKQFVQTSSDLLEIEDNVTIQSVQQTNGSTKDSGTVKYTNPDYESADSLEGYKALMQNLSETQAQINARQERLLNNSGGGGGGLFDFDGLGASLPFGGAGVAAALGAIVVLGLVTRN